jgi:hypothetical protein
VPSASQSLLKARGAAPTSKVQLPFSPTNWIAILPRHAVAEPDGGISSPWVTPPPAAPAVRRHLLTSVRRRRRVCLSLACEGVRAHAVALAKACCMGGSTLTRGRTFRRKCGQPPKAPAPKTNNPITWLALLPGVRHTQCGNSSPMPTFRRWALGRSGLGW